jgi:hypothetical protein
MRKKALAVINAAPQDLTPSSMIMAAITGKADLEKVKQLLEIQKDQERWQAEKAYNKAIADFKANPPQIIKESKVDFTSERTQNRTSYKYAALANVIEKVTPELSKHGLTVSWRTEQNGKIKVTCRISHELGHYEETALSADAETSGTKNPIQAIGSAITYMQRYTVLALLGLACSDQDDDGRASGKPIETNLVPPKQMSLKEMITKMAKEKFNTPELFQIWRVDNDLPESMEGLSEIQLAKVFNYLKAKK